MTTPINPANPLNNMSNMPELFKELLIFSNTFDGKIVMSVVFTLVMLGMIFQNIQSLKEKKRGTKSKEVDESWNVVGIVFFALMIVINAWFLVFHPNIIP